MQCVWRWRENEFFRNDYLLKLAASYNAEYRENNHLSLEEDAKLWLHLSRLQDALDCYDAENDTEEIMQPFLCWEDDAYDADETPDENSSYSLLNPIKLRFINSEAGDKFFSKISAEINEKTDDLKSIIQFDLIVDEKERRISFDDGEFIEAPLGANDLLHIFQKMSFHASYKERVIKGKSVTTFKIKF